MANTRVSGTRKSSDIREIPFYEGLAKRSEERENVMEEARVDWFKGIKQIFLLDFGSWHVLGVTMDNKWSIPLTTAMELYRPCHVLLQLSIVYLSKCTPNILCLLVTSSQNFDT